MYQVSICCECIKCGYSKPSVLCEKEREENASIWCNKTNMAFVKVFICRPRTRLIKPNQFDVICSFVTLKCQRTFPRRHFFRSLLNYKFGVRIRFSKWKQKQIPQSIEFLSPAESFPWTSTAVANPVAFFSRLLTQIHHRQRRFVVRSQTGVDDNSISIRRQGFY